jgi:serine/threonine protein kinase
LLEAWQFSSLQPACKGPPLPERYLGRSLGKYQVTRLLGAGAFAWVYEAIDRDLEIPVALKILRPEFAGVPGAEARFRKEATTAARLRHPNIVTVRDVGTAEGTVFVAMDLLPLSLARRLDVLPRLPETEVVRFALDVAAALSIAHADGVVHRDIKPDNVLLGPNGEAVVADFGLAGAFTDSTGDISGTPANEVLGTPHYFSPEQARGLDMDGRADLYALGVMCYRASTGRLPFEGDDWYAVARQHIEDAPIPPRSIVPELTEGFEAIVLKLMAKEPDKRFASATQLADALLVLPTAPTGRSMALMSNAVTQIASPYALSLAVPLKRTFAKRATYTVIALALLAAVGVYALPSTGPFSLQSLFQRTTSTIAVAPRIDTLVLNPTQDSVIPHRDTLPSVIEPVLLPKHAASPPKVAKAHVDVSTSDSAQLWVNDVLMEKNQWTGDLLLGQKQHFRALLRGNPDGCTSARRDTVVTFTAVRAESMSLDVQPCGVLLLTIKSQDADYTLTGRDFEASVSGTYTGEPVPIVLRVGRYALRVRKERCTTYEDDSVQVVHGVQKGDTLSRTVAPLCN